jgi:hypothetical protein
LSFWSGTPNITSVVSGQTNPGRIFAQGGKAKRKTIRKQAGMEFIPSPPTEAILPYLDQNCQQ